MLVTHAAVFGGFSAHSWTTALWSNLTVGVAIFFVISGFLLYRPLLATQVLGARGTSLGTYAWRRFLRIIPAYWLALTILAWWANLHRPAAWQAHGPGGSGAGAACASSTGAACASSTGAACASSTLRLGIGTYRLSDNAGRSTR